MGNITMNGELLGIARRSKPREPMETPNEVLVTIGAGVEGDCHGTVPDRQVTVISAGSWRAACRILEWKSLGPNDERISC